MKIILVLSILFFSVISSKAQETIDLNQAINTALANSNIVNSLEKSVEMQNLNVSTSKGNLFPTLNFSATWSRNNTFSEGTVRFENGVPIIIPKQDSWINNFNLGLNSRVTLFNGFANYEDVNLQKQNVSLAQIELNKQKYDIIYSVNTAFFDVLKKVKIVTANEENLIDSKAQLNLVTEFKNVGKRTLADVYRQDVQVAQNELALERSVNELEKSKVDLLLAMNSDLNRKYNLSEENIDTSLTEEELKVVLDRNSNMDILVNRALTNRYDYRSSEQDIRVSRVQYSIDKKFLYYPTLSGFASYNLSASRIENLVDSRSLSFGLTLSYSIFQGFNLRNRSQASEITIRQKQDNIRQLEQSIISEIKKSTIDLQTQYKQVEILNRNILSAEQDKLLSEENYRVGLGTLLDVQTASTKLNTLKIDLINAYYDFLLTERRIRYYSGDLNY